MNYPYAGFFKRATALLIDSVLVAALPTLLCVPLFSVQYDLLLQLPETTTKYQIIASLLFLCSVLWQILFLLIYWLYFAFCESSRKQATLGKRLLGIKVVNQQGRRIRFWRATARALARLAMPFTCYIGFVMAGCTRRNRALHDMFVQTYVVSKDFKSTDPLPDTPGHPIWLIIWSTLLIIFTLAGILSTPSDETDEQDIVVAPPPVISQPAPVSSVQQAQKRLIELAGMQATVPAGVQPDGIRYFRHADGYRALLPNSITLFLPNGQTQACCEEDNTGSCQAASLTACP